MAVGGDYAVPVTVNGFTCRNCTDVDYADKHIDPAHPKSGPYGVTAKTDPSQTQAQTQTSGAAATQGSTRAPAIEFGGQLAALASASASAATPAGGTAPSTPTSVRATPGDGTGARLDLYA